MALKNVGASVRARLLRMAQERHDSFEGLLVRYVHERLLYRLGRSEQATRFALKGALLFPLWGPEVPRATRRRREDPRDDGPETLFPEGDFGGVDGTRTRDLRRDRPAF